MVDYEDPDDETSELITSTYSTLCCWSWFDPIPLLDIDNFFQERVIVSAVDSIVLAYLDEGWNPFRDKYLLRDRGGSRLTWDRIRTVSEEEACMYLLEGGVDASEYF